eukprot:5190374-Prymnesium_polylepis.2
MANSCTGYHRGIRFRSPFRVSAPCHAHPARCVCAPNVVDVTASPVSAGLAALSPGAEAIATFVDDQGIGRRRVIPQCERSTKAGETESFMRHDVAISLAERQWRLNDRRTTDVVQP